MLACEARSPIWLLYLLAVKIEDMWVRVVFICLLAELFLGEACPGAIPAVRKFL